MRTVLLASIRGITKWKLPDENPSQLEFKWDLNKPQEKHWQHVVACLGQKAKQQVFNGKPIWFALTTSEHAICALSAAAKVSSAASDGQSLSFSTRKRVQEAFDLNFRLF